VKAKMFCAKFEQLKMISDHEWPVLRHVWKRVVGSDIDFSRITDVGGIILRNRKKNFMTILRDDWTSELQSIDCVSKSWLW
jgi:hypothetical protein